MGCALYVPLVDGEAERRARLHDVAPSGERAKDRPAAQALAQRGDVGRHAEVILDARRARAEPREDLVEDEDDAVPGRQLADRAQRTRGAAGSRRSCS